MTRTDFSHSNGLDFTTGNGEAPESAQDVNSDGSLKVFQGSSANAFSPFRTENGGLHFNTANFKAEDMKAPNQASSSNSLKDHMLNIAFDNTDSKAKASQDDNGEFPALFCHEGDCTLG